MKKVGGLTFIRVGRFSMSFCMCREGNNDHVLVGYGVLLVLGAVVGVIL